MECTQNTNDSFHGSLRHPATHRLTLHVNVKHNYGELQLDSVYKYTYSALKTRREQVANARLNMCKVGT